MPSHKLLPAFVAALVAMTFALPVSTLAATEGDVIKLACPENSAIEDPCRAVYYVGIDGMRHAFPSLAVYNSWYDNFDNVIEVSQEEMNAFPLGKNVTLKPGTSVIKFQTSDPVYAVAEGGILRHYTTEELVIADYGDDWSTNDLILMPDALFNDYEKGDPIDSEDDYDPGEAESGVTSIDDNF